MKFLFFLLQFCLLQLTVNAQDTSQLHKQPIQNNSEFTQNPERNDDKSEISDRWTAKDFGMLTAAVLIAILTLGSFAKANKDIKDLKADQEKKIDEVRKSLDEKISKEVESNIAKKSEEFVSKYFAEKVGVNPVVVRDFFQKLERANESVKARRLLVVNQNEGKRLDLLSEIEKAGFSTPHFKKLIELESGINQNDFDILLIDNELGTMGEKDIEDLIRGHHNALKIVCFTGQNLQSYNELKQMARIIQMKDRLVQALIDSSKH